VNACGQEASRAGRVTEAAALYRRGIGADPLCEGLYQALMRCLLDADHTSEAYAVYRQCRETLSIVLGIPPSARTEALRQEAAFRREPATVALLPTTN
jgi:LuxR family transcriptional regulator, maltose regulon positive regulatory protein